jgi:alkylhydroperoxidase family enzyme
MPRLRPIPRAEVTDEHVLERYSFLFGDRDPVAEPGTATGSPGDWWTVFALVPDVMRHATRGFALYRDPARKLDPRLRELAQTRAGWARGSQFVFSQHVKASRGVGLSAEKIEAVPHWAVATCYDATERAVLAYTDCLVLDGGRVPDGLFDELRAALGDEAVLELTYITCMYEMHATICRALRLEFDDRPEPVVEVAAPEGGSSVLDLGATIAGSES